MPIAKRWRLDIAFTVMATRCSSYSSPMHAMSFRVATLVSAVMLAPALAGAQAPAAGQARGGGRPRVTPTRTDTPPVIDGKLDDPVWKSAARLGGFVQQRPNEGTPASEKTDVYIAYDKDTLYFGIYAHYSDPTIMRANRVDR